jgi:hypothetical protein
MRLPGEPGIDKWRNMPTDQGLPENEESIKNPPSAIELETKPEELKPEDAEKISGGGPHPHQL